MPRKRHESGYALLMVFVLAATIAISLYSVAPRVAFESQRDKEQLLVDRGEQYKRAIQLYYRKYRKYPVKMEDLENTQNIRFLRQRYIDPMTGKNEWRLIHVGPGGQFTDSLTQKNNSTKKQDPASVNTFIAEFKSVADPTDAVDQLSPALRRRPSDQGAVNGGTLGGDGNGMVAPVDPNNPNPDPNLNAGAFPPGGAMPGAFPGALPGVNGFPNDGSGIPPNPTGYVPGGEMPLAMQQQLQQQMQQNGQAPTLVIGAGGNIGPQNTTTQTYYPGGTQPNLSGPAAIQQLLTSPRPGGPPPGIFNPSGRQMNDYGFTDQNGNNIPTPMNPQSVGMAPNSAGSFGNTGNVNSNGLGGSTGNTIGSPLGNPVQSSGGGNFATGSFAGVASTLERHGIKKYADHNKYNEWEFLYDYAKDVAKASGLAVNGAAANGNSPGQNGLTNTLGNSPGPAGSNFGSSALNSGSAAGGANTGSLTPVPVPPTN